MGKIIVLVLHSTEDPNSDKSLRNLKDVLNLCDRIMVHTVTDLNRLKSIGLVNNVCIIPHGIELMSNAIDKKTTRGAKIQIASYGFALPHKGIIELIEAFSNVIVNVPNAELFLLNAEHPDPISGNFIAQINKKVLELGLSNNVKINNSYLDERECVKLLAESDVIVMPYQQTGESSSAAVRTALASNQPVLVTPLRIFDDVKNAVTYLQGSSVDDIANGIMDFLNGNLKWDEDKANVWKNNHRYELVSERMLNVINSLIVNGKYY